jgi:HD-GYP domain-containing protein (c-di-GMP phosphodiesterase class II)
LSQQIARKLGMTKGEVWSIALAGRLHDIGKVTLPWGLLQKKGQFSSIERKHMQIHPEAGHSIIKAHINDPIILCAVLEHHERWDGSGYPKGKRRPSKPGQILAVTDYYDARQDPRSYRYATLAPKEAIDATMAEPFDPEVLDAFFTVVAKGHPQRR